MKKITIKSSKTLKLNKTTIVKLDAAKMNSLWGGVNDDPADQSTRPQCDLSETTNLIRMTY